MPRHSGRHSLGISGLVLVLAVLLPPGFAHAAGGRLVIRIEGDLSGPIPPTLTVSGPSIDESRLLDALALASRQILYEKLESGVYRLTLSGADASTQGAEAAIEVGVHEGLTTILRAEIGACRLTIDPFRPDPFGCEDGWDVSWLEALPGAGEEGALAAETSPMEPRRTDLDRLDLTGAALHHSVRVRGESMVRSVRSPIGLVPASEETAARQILSRFDPSFGEIEGAAGDRSRNSYEGTVSRHYSKVAWEPRFLLSLSGLDYSDAAPSVFSSGDPLPHNDLAGLDLFGRVDLKPAAATRLTALLYGDGTQRNHFIEAYRHDTSHSPREDRATIVGGLRAVRQEGERFRILGELDVQRTYMATGDGRYFDSILSYGRASGAGNPGAEEDELYWLGDDPNTQGDEGHRYNYFRRNVQVDWIGRLEAWRDPGTSRTAGAGLLFRRGTYRSYENLDPAGGETSQVSAIGYDALGESHSDEEGREPGNPMTLAGFATTRHPFSTDGGEIEFGLRATYFSTGQKSIRNLSDPFGGDKNLDPADLKDASSHASIDPRIGYTRPLGGRARLWISGGSETRIPPSDALYYSQIYLASVAGATDPDRPIQMIFGNPDLKPEQAWMGLLALGFRPSPALSLRVGAQGSRIADAITPRAYAVGPDSLAYYVNDGTRDLIDLFARAECALSPDVSARVSYDLSRARTETVEPALLDEAWYGGTLPPRSVDLREGLVQSSPLVDDGVDRGFYPSTSDRRHRISVAIVARPSADLLGESGRVIFNHFEASALFRAVSGGPFTWTLINAAGLLPQQAPGGVVNGRDRNEGRLPWTGQLDLRFAKSLTFQQGEVQLWFEVTNVTDQKNVIRVYQATGEGDDDAALGAVVDGDDQRFAQAYTDRIRDPRNYGEPRLMRVGLRLRLP
jgi:hypothetical protein